VHASPLRLVCVFLYGSRQFLDWSAIIFSNLLARLRKVNGSAATIEAYAIRMHKKRIGAGAIYSAFLRFWENTRATGVKFHARLVQKNNRGDQKTFRFCSAENTPHPAKEFLAFIGTTGVTKWPASGDGQTAGISWPVRNSRVVSQPGNGDKEPIPSGQDACRRKLRP
jgi:hypothetical protein